MKLRAVVTSKGQVTIPKPVHEAVGIRESLAELAWTLRLYYRQPSETIAATLAQILDMRSIRLLQKATWREAIMLYSQYNVDLVDAYHAAQMRRRQLRRIFSYDADFDQLGAKREEP